MSDNPYGYADEPGEIVKAGSVQVEESRAVAEVKAQVVMARRFPRDPVLATDRILAECDRVTLAEKAVYSYPRGGTQVSGPSIRLAEAISRAWGNLAAGVVEVERVGAESSMLAYAWDLETNTMIRKEFKVKHVRDSKKGGKQEVSDERDIYEITANQAARRLRACILSLIPGDVVEAAVNRCEKTLTANVGDLPAAITKMVKVFEGIGVGKALLEKRLRHRVEATQSAEIVQLRNVYNSIRDGMGTIQDYFELDGPAKAPEDVVQQAKKGPGRPPKASPEPAPAEGTLGLTTDGAEQLWGTLLEYGNAPDLPKAAKADIEAAIARNEGDPIILRNLLNKVKAAYEKK